MKITSYLSQIPNLFGKAGLLEDLRYARNQFILTEDVLARADKEFGAKFKSTEMKYVQQAFSGVVKYSAGKGIFGFLATNTSNIVAGIDTLTAIVSGEFEEKIAAKGLNYRKANLIQLVDAVTFMTRFTPKLLTYAAKNEIRVTRDEKKLPAIDSTDSVPYEQEWFKKGLIPFLQVVAIMAQPAAKMIDRLDQIPDILADEHNYANLARTTGEAKLDPFMFSINNFAWNPIRAIRMNQVEIKIARVKEAEVELAMTNLRLLQVQRAKQGKEDPVLEREVTYLQNRANSLAREIADAEE